MSYLCPSFLEFAMSLCLAMLYPRGHGHGCVRVRVRASSHMAIKIENQVKRGSSNTCSTPSPSSSTWKSNQWRKEEKPPNAKPKTEQKQEVTSQENQGKPNHFTTQNRDIKCFKCQGRVHISPTVRRYFHKTFEWGSGKLSL